MTSREPSPRTGGLMKDPIWVESNDEKDAARALEMLHVQLISAVIDPYSWKWVMVALHHALQTFVLASLNRGEKAKVLEPRVTGEPLQVRYGGTDPYPEHQPDYLSDLYERMKKATGFPSAAEVDPDVARMIEFRNALIQRIPDRWLLRVNDLPRMSRNCLKVVEYLGWNPGHIGWQKENLTDLARVKFLASVKVLEALEGQYHA